MGKSASVGTDLSDFGLIGLSVMGSNLALNVEEHGFSVSVWNRSSDVTKGFVDGNPGKRLRATGSLEELVRSIARPRRVMLMIKAGPAVDDVIQKLVPLLEPGDVLVDGGNTWFEDTQRRERELAAHGLRFFGVGVSGGEEGARHGPSLMPGGDREAYEGALRPVLEAIAARTDSGPCVTYVGPDGAGHFVKMVHNGIEYADMQLIAEAYDVLARTGGLGADELARVFGEWNRGPLESFLIEITAKIFGVRDPETKRPLVELVLDRAGQKGTGRWTMEVALKLGVAVPSIAAALDARVLSSMKEERVETSRRFALELPATGAGPRDLVADVHDALWASKICAYAQGMQLIRAGSDAFSWGVNPVEVARIWKGGCIIRARFLDDIRAAYEREPSLPNLVLDAEFQRALARTHGGLRSVVALAQSRGVPVPAFSASLAWLDACRTADLPQNLTQAQRDAFGSHTYVRRDHPERGPQHTEWL